MNNVQENVVNTINRYKLLEEGDKVVLAVSGGPDSICMLDVLYKIILNKTENNNTVNAKKARPFWQCQKSPSLLAVAHVNHMIREEAGEDEAFVREYCKKLGVEFYSKSIDVQQIANNNKIGLEEAGRIARYDFFDEVAAKVGANKIAIAHNKNDSVETVIMHALRGSGTKGLEGIQPQNGKYIRPLIDCERSEIEQYCKDNNIDARIDKTNMENVYTRNKIRNIAIPYIKEEFNPNIIETISRLSKLIKEENDFIDGHVENVFNKIVIKDLVQNIENRVNNDNQIDDLSNNNEDSFSIILDLKQFNLQEKVIKSRLVLYTINRLFGTTKGIEKIHIEDIIKLCENNIGNKYLTPNKNIKIFVKGR